MWIRYWLKVVAVGTALTIALIAVFGGVGLAISRVPEPCLYWIVGGGIFLALVTGMSALIHIYQRTH